MSALKPAVVVDETYLTESLADLVRTDSRNPSLTPGSVGEAEAGALLADAMRELGLEVTVQELGEKRVNVVGIRRGTGGGRSLMWNGHLDTVGVQGMADPFGASIRDGKLYGRGSQDMKASLAAMLAAVKALNDGAIRLAGDLILTAVADEEYASIGTEAIVGAYGADAALVLEPTDMAICRGHRGFIWYTIEVTGRAAHGSRYAEGIDAILHMGRVLVELEKLGQALLARPAHALAGPPSLHASLIAGGTELSVYPASCHLQLERRTIPGESVTQATAELQAILDRLAAADPTFRAELTTFFDRAPFSVAEDAPIVAALEQAVMGRTGAPPQHVGATFWTDAALLAEAGIDTVLIGPIGQGLHSAEEWVELASVADLTAILADTAIAYCGTG